jgi:CRP/FNR family transcriptional regulator, cyclic AMP receptor protein
MECCFMTQSDWLEVNQRPFDHRAFMEKHRGGTLSRYCERQAVFVQGDPANAVFYIISGTVKVTVNSENGKEAVIAILGNDNFFGEGCLQGRQTRRMSVTATSPCEIVRLDRPLVLRALDSDPEFGKLFMRFLLNVNEKLKADLTDQFFNSSEKRLARVLLMLSNIELGGEPSPIEWAVNQETLASMVGTTRSRINQFMNKFRKLGYIDYKDRIVVKDSLFSLILGEQRRDNENLRSQERR